MTTYTVYSDTDKPMVQFDAYHYAVPPTSVRLHPDAEEGFINMVRWASDVMESNPDVTVEALVYRMGRGSYALPEGESTVPRVDTLAEARANLRAAMQAHPDYDDSAEEDPEEEEDDEDPEEDEIEKSRDIDAFAPISKADEERQIVYGWAYVTHNKDGEVVVDKSGEFVDDITEIEKTAVQFMLESRKGDVHHTNVHSTDIVESMVFTPEKMAAMGIEKGTLPSGWWIGVKCSDPVWAEYKAGRLKAFSVHGKGLKKAV